MRICRMAIFQLLASVMAAQCVSAYYGEHDVLREMASKAESIAVIKVIDLTLALPLHEAGVEHWTATCQIIEPIKGELKTDQKVAIVGNTVVGFGEKTAKLEKDKQYVVFLQARRDASMPYHLLDRWVGAPQFDTYLVQVVKMFVKEQKEQKK